MLETRNCGYALGVCLALITAACGAVAPDEAQADIDERGSDIVGCAPDSKDGACDGGEEVPRSPEAQCKEQYVACLAKGVGEEVCRTLFSECMANVPPPEPTPEPDPVPEPEPGPSPEQCKLKYYRCLDTTGDEQICRKKLEACMGTPPPPPPPSSEEQCFLTFRFCYEVTGELDACFARLKLCLAQPPPTPPPPPAPTPEEQCKLEYNNCVPRTGDELACRARYQQCVENSPQPTP